MTELRDDYVHGETSMLEPWLLTENSEPLRGSCTVTCLVRKAFVVWVWSSGLRVEDWVQVAAV